MAHQVAVIGMGRFGMSLAQELFRVGHDVLAVDRDESLTQAMMGLVTYSVNGDSTSPEFLDEAGIRNFDTAAVAIGTDIQSSVLTTVLLKQHFQIPRVVARAISRIHGTTLEAVGADRVVYPEQETGVREAHSLFQRDVQEYMELAAGFGFSKVAVPQDMVGQSLGALGLSTVRDRYGAAVVAIRRGREPILSPSKDEVLQRDDLLVIASREETLERFGLE